jgi:23S rRNA (uracil1939-C5)-methyltransferase
MSAVSSLKPSEFLSCSYASLCAGCDWLLKPASEQRSLKEEAFREIWKNSDVGRPLPANINWVSTGLGASRDRVDLMFDRKSGTAKLGLFDRFRTGIVDLQGCPQLSPQLEAWLQEFRKFEFPIQRGSIRLRVAPDGTKGAWLDFANVDVKTLLDERTTLDALMKIAVVEIGQRRKRLVEKEGRLKLEDPVLAPWFETYDGEKKIALYSTIGSFTQPGFNANRALIGETVRLSSPLQPKRVAEFGSGIGNFTLPLALHSEHVDAYEVDSLALEGLKRTLNEQRLTEKVSIHSGNYQGDKALALDFTGIDLLLVDPPRSGLMKFLDPLAAMPPAARPKAVVYVSCFAESFAADSKRLFDMGYELREISIVDQFPQSRHFETIALFQHIH